MPYSPPVSKMPQLPDAVWAGSGAAGPPIVQERKNPASGRLRTSLDFLHDGHDRSYGPFRRQQAPKRQDADPRTHVEGVGVVAEDVEQPPGDDRPDDPGDTPCREQQSVIHPQVLRSEEVARR